MSTENKERSTLGKIGRGLFFSGAAILLLFIMIFATIAALTIYDDSGIGKYADVNASLFFSDGIPKIAHGGYFKLSYEGDSWTEDFGRGAIPKCKFSRINLKKNKEARIKVALKNGLGTVTWTKGEDIFLMEGNNPVILFAELKEIK